MINFRYHVVSLVAIFLSLGIGVLVGASFIDRGTVAVLKGTQSRLAKSNQDLQKKVTELEQANSGLDQYARLVKPAVIRGKIAGKRTIVLTLDPATEVDVQKEVVETLIEAGGTLDGVVRLSERLDLQTEPRRQQVALALQMESQDETELRRALIERLIGSLSGRSPGMVGRLVETNLASLSGAEGANPVPGATIAAPGTIVVMIGGAPDTAPLSEVELLAPLARGLAEQGVVVAVVDAGNAKSDFLGPIRRDPSLRIVSIDGIEGAVGQTALALALEGALSGRFGHYGTGEGASDLMPQAKISSSPSR